MSRSDDKERCDELAPPVYKSIRLLLDQMELDAIVSYPTVEEIVIHFWRDIDRLFAIHHETVHPTKACSYLAFWVRKLKPISMAFPKSAIHKERDIFPFEIEVADVNEQIAVHIALSWTRRCIEEERFTPDAKVQKELTLLAFDKSVEDYLTSYFEDGMEMGVRFDNIVYDMRFRTFGPHHLTHMLTNLMREVARKCQEQPA